MRSSRPRSSSRWARPPPFGLRGGARGRALRRRSVDGEGRRRHGRGPRRARGRGADRRGPKRRPPDCPPRARRVGRSLRLPLQRRAGRGATARLPESSLTQRAPRSRESGSPRSPRTCTPVLLKIRPTRSRGRPVQARLQLGNVDPRFAALVNDLGELRKSARYAESELRVDAGDARAKLAVAEEMYEISERGPTRAPPQDDEGSGLDPSDP